jgi:hypothetical protein
MDNQLVILLNVPINARYAEPEKNIGHKFLTPSITDSSNALSLHEVVLWTVASCLAFACIVYTELGHLSRGVYRLR